jgi:hypothetical protein
VNEVSETDIIAELETIIKILQDILNKLPYTVVVPPTYTPPLPTPEYCMCPYPEPTSGGYCAKCGKRMQYSDIIYFSNDNSSNRC